MTRKEFIETSMKMGMGIPFLSALMMESCSKSELEFPEFKTDFKGKVLIIGAGAAGLSAGYLLKRYGVEFEILEAAPVYGGRLKKAMGFADFPIDLGAEWIHVHPVVLSDMLNNKELDANIDVLVYNPQTIQTWHNGKLKSHNYIRGFYSEWKFKSSTWFDFFETYMVSEIANSIKLNKAVTEINYAGNQVQVKTAEGELYEADKVLISTSVKTFQNQMIQFEPALPENKIQAFSKITMGDGIKVFIEFSKRFYPDMLAFGSILSALEEEEKFYYDAAFRKDSNRHILGLFAINEKASAYTSLETEAAIIQKILTELDEIFDGEASPNYVQHIIQNWSAQPYIGGAYSYSFTGDQEDIVKEISVPLAGKLFFAGEAYSIEHQATVHGACQSAYISIEKMLKG